MVLVLAIAVPVILLLAWGFAFDRRQRRRHQPLTGPDSSAAARNVRLRDEGRGSEWSNGGF